MTKLVSISGIITKVSDLKKTAEFYEGLGFLTTKKEDDHYALRLNWFWMEFIEVAGDFKHPSGQSIYVAVDNVDDVYQDLIAKGYEFTTEPTDYPSGRREAMLCDPDGYWVVIFHKR
jgi:predicted enzyme related to lactoylglutathione lyase